MGNIFVIGNACLPQEELSGSTWSRPARLGVHDARGHQSPGEGEHAVDATVQLQQMAMIGWSVRSRQGLRASVGPLALFFSVIFCEDLAGHGM